MGRGLDSVNVQMVRARVIGISSEGRFQCTHNFRRPRLRLAILRPVVPRIEIHECLCKKRGHIGIVGKALDDLSHSIRVGHLKGGAIPDRFWRVTL